MFKPGTLGSGAAVLALVLGVPTSTIFVAPQPAHADDCLLDTNNDGDADATIDTDGGADSAGVDARLACGVNATASGAGSAAIGGGATASGTSATAVGPTPRRPQRTRPRLGRL